VADSTTAGVLVFLPLTGWVAPLHEHALHSVTVEVVEALMMAAGIGFARRAIEFDELALADEVICCSTPTGPLPVVELDGRPIGGGQAGPEYKKLAKLWSDRVGLDYRRQARQLSIADC
jgi:D-alanine transaminase